MQQVVVWPNGEDLEHVFEYSAAVVGLESRQETVYVEDLDNRYLDLCADASQGASRENTSVQRRLQHRLWLSIETHAILSSLAHSLRSDSSPQWSEHGPEKTPNGLWVTHNNDPITIPSLPPPLLTGFSNDPGKETKTNNATLLEARAEDSDRHRRSIVAQESIHIMDELCQGPRASYNRCHWKTVTQKSPH